MIVAGTTRASICIRASGATGPGMGGVGIGAVYLREIVLITPQPAAVFHSASVAPEGTTLADLVPAWQSTLSMRILPIRKLALSFLFISLLSDLSGSILKTSIKGLEI